MPFDPRVIGEDDDFLPDEFGGDEQLEALGAQLRDDAVHLASVFPAKPMPMKDIEPPQRLRQPRLFWLSAVAAACVVFLVVPLSIKLLRSDNTPAVLTTVLQPSEGVVEVVGPVSPTAPVPAETVPVTPVVQQNLTGPEWEAVLDLLEYEPEPGQSISL